MRALIVVAEQDDLALHHQIDALARVRPVADDIAQTVDFADGLFLDVLEDRLQGLQVTVNVADDRLHAWLSQGRSACAKAVSAHSPWLVRGRMIRKNGYFQVYLSA